MGDMFSAPDLRLFRWLNGPAGLSPAFDTFVIFGATWLIFLMAALEIGYVAVAWKTARFEERFENLVQAVWAALIGYATQGVLGFLWFRPRPFVALSHVVKLVERAPFEKSFPSAHATVAFALAFAMFARDRKWGSALLAMAVAVALCRVAAGVHYPSDALGGAFVGWIASRLAAPARKAVEPYLDLFAVFRDHKPQRT